MNRSNLIIIQNINDELINNLDHENTDFVCIDIDSMLKLKKAGLPFKSFYDYYTQEEYIENLKARLNELEKILNILDTKYASIIKYPRVFMGNYYPFLVYFADFFFISEVIARLQNKYRNVSFYTSYKEEDIKNYLNNIFFDFFDPFSILKNRNILIAGLLSKGLNSEIVFCKPDNDNENPGKFDYYLSLLMKSNKRLLVNYLISCLKNRLFLQRDGNKKAIFSIDMNYEPLYLREFMNEFNFINPIEIIRKDNCLKKKNLPSFLESERESIINLTTLNNKTFFDLLEIYHREVISLIPSFIDETKENIRKWDPSGVFFSIGQYSNLESIVAFLANTYQIPIFNFQHGDGIEFVDDVLNTNKYIELNENIQKTLILRSKKQYDLLNKIRPDNIELFHGGSCKIYSYKKRLTEKKVKKNKKVLIILGDYPADAYSGLSYIENDLEIFDKHNNMLKIIKKYNINADIKIFPRNKYMGYFKDLITYHEIKTVNIIVQPDVEFLLPDYDMILMEYIGSALTPLLMVLCIPIVYWINANYLNENLADDFSRRHHIVTSEVEFESIIKQFKDNALNSKYDRDLIKTYCFPSETTNPAQIISDFVKERIIYSSNRRLGY